MSDRMTSWLRTVVPGLWSTVITWLIGHDAPGWLVDLFRDAGNVVVMPVVLAVVYGLFRLLEPQLPSWATKLLMGSSKPPSYQEMLEQVQDELEDSEKGPDGSDETDSTGSKDDAKSVRNSGADYPISS